MQNLHVRSVRTGIQAVTLNVLNTLSGTRHEKKLRQRLVRGTMPKKKRQNTQCQALIKTKENITDNTYERGI